MNQKKNKPITHVVKRDGRIVPFDEEKIAEGIYRAAASIGGHKKELSKKLAHEVTLIVNQNPLKIKGFKADSSCLSR